MYYYGIWDYLYGCMGIIYRFTEKLHDLIVPDFLERPYVQILNVL